MVPEALLGSGAPAAALLVYAHLDWYASQRGEAWPSLRTLSERTALNMRRVYKALRWLQEAGFLEIQAGKGRGHCNTYVLRDRLARKAVVAKRNVPPVAHISPGNVPPVGNVSPLNVPPVAHVPRVRTFAKAKVRRKIPPAALETVDALHENYRTTFERAHGFAPGLEMGLGRRVFAELYVNQGRDRAEIERVTAAYVTSEDRWLQKLGWPLKYLLQHYDGVLAALKERAPHGARATTTSGARAGPGPGIPPAPVGPKCRLPGCGDRAGESGFCCEEHRREHEYLWPRGTGQGPKSDRGREQGGANRRVNPGTGQPTGGSL